MIKMKKAFQQFTLIVILVSSFKINAQDYIAPPMVNVPSGSFIMGSEKGGINVKPAHQVSISKFQMSKYLITVAEYQKFIKETNYKSSAEKCPDFIDQNWYSDRGEKSNGTWKKHNLSYSDYQPVTCISFQDVYAYISWLNKKTGLKYRLPTESEWEYAARANTSSKYFWGNDERQTHLYANFADHSSEYFVSKQFGASYNGFIGITNANDGEPYGAIVGLYRSNPFGLYDMLGNVSQMLASCYNAEGYANKYIYDKKTNDCEFIVTRGGNWHYKPKPIWYRGRTKVGTGFASTRRGFRLALDGHFDKTDNSTVSFEKELKKAQHVRLATRIIIPDAPESVILKKNNTNDYTLSWKVHNNKAVIEYDIYQSTNSHAHLLGKFYKNYYKKIKTVTANQNSLKVLLTEKGNSFRVVAVTKEENSLSSNPVFISKKSKLITIPGNLTMENNVVLKNAKLGYREANNEVPELYYLRILGNAFVPKMGMISFNTDVENTGWYKVNYTGGPRSRKSRTFFMVYQNNKFVGEVNYDSKIDNRTTNIHKVYLEKGKSKLKISFFLNLETMDMWNVGTIKLTKLD